MDIKMQAQDEPVERLYQDLQKLIGLHRRLLDVVRAEHEAIVQAQLKAIQEATFGKQALIESIRQAEAERVITLERISALWKKPAQTLTLSNVIIELQGGPNPEDQKRAELFRSCLNTLALLIKRITEQNEENKSLVDRSLLHIGQMKKNVLGEASPKSDRYTQQGKFATQAPGARLLSTEV